MFSVGNTSPYKNKFSIYPNPSWNKLTLKNNDLNSGFTYSILDLLGQEIIINKTIFL